MHKQKLLLRVLFKSEKVKKTFDFRLNGQSVVFKLKMSTKRIYISNRILNITTVQVFFYLLAMRVNILNVQINLWMHIILQGHCNGCL